MFKPARNNGHRLRSYGIEGHVPCIQSEICLSVAIQIKLHVALASISSANPTDSNIRDLHNGTLQVKSGRLSKRGPPPWVGLRTDICTDHIQQLAGKMIEQAVPNTAAVFPRPYNFIVTCHVCRSCKDVAYQSLVRKGRWAIIYCNSCKASRKASKWLCPCQRPWHTCSLHRQNGMACRRPLQLHASISKQVVKRYTELGTHDEPVRKKRTCTTSSRCQRPSVRQEALAAQSSDSAKPAVLLLSGQLPSVGKGSQTSASVSNIFLNRSSCTFLGDASESRGVHDAGKFRNTAVKRKANSETVTAKRRKSGQQWKGADFVARILSMNGSEKLAAKFPQLSGRPPE